MRRPRNFTLLESRYLNRCSGMLFGMARARTSTHRHAANTSRAEHLTLMAALFKTLSDPSRLQILMELRDYDEVCVGDLAAWTGISESAVSHALRLLRAYGIVEARREGHWVFYSLVDEHVRVLLDATAHHFDQAHR
jgi:DNA-binding transcriptional ArsR family regulator